MRYIICLSCLSLLGWFYWLTTRTPSELAEAGVKLGQGRDEEVEENDVNVPYEYEVRG